jgi:hypothetical protein
LKSTCGFCLKPLINHILHNSEQTHLGSWENTNPVCRAQQWVKGRKMVVKLCRFQKLQKTKIKTNDET